MLRHDAAWRAASRHTTPCHMTPRHSTTRHGTAQHHTTWHGAAWHGTARRGTTPHSAAPFDTAHTLRTIRRVQLDVLEFFVWADAELLKLDGGFGRRFRPILASLAGAWGMRLAGMEKPEKECGGVARPFVGWMASGERHWLMDQLSM